MSPTRDSRRTGRRSASLSPTTSPTSLAQDAPHAGPQAALVQSYLKQLRLPAMARECLPLAREADAQHSSYLDYLHALLEHEVSERREHQIQRRLHQARFPYTKRLEDFDFSA